MFLFKTLNNKKAHFWDEGFKSGDTYCKMFSTGGLRKNKYVLSETKQGRDICTMCQNVHKKIHGYQG